jgi:hypothetical protein
VNAGICDAIAHRWVLQFHYGGGLRVVEPYRHGYSTAGKEVLRGYQVSGYSQSRNPQGWRLFDVGKIGQLQAAPETFAATRPGYNAKDSAMRFVHCQAERRDNGHATPRR